MACRINEEAGPPRRCSDGASRRFSVKERSRATIALLMSAYCPEEVEFGGFEIC